MSPQPQLVPPPAPPRGPTTSAAAAPGDAPQPSTINSQPSPLRVFLTRCLNNLLGTVLLLLLVAFVIALPALLVMALGFLCAAAEHCFYLGYNLLTQS
jgi:hypothetical protein